MVDVIKGPGGQYWEHLRKSDTPNHQAHIGAYILDAPWIHPAWSQYVFNLVHLRPLEEVDEAVIIAYPRATHHMWVYALDPKVRMTPETDPQDPVLCLTPQNHSLQFTAPDDARALQ